MSIYDDDGFDEEAAELSEAITGSYTGSGGGQQTGFSFDDGGDSGVNVTLGTSDPRGGTSITGNVIRGGTIFGRTPSQQARQQRLSGMGDYRNSEARCSININCSESAGRLPISPRGHLIRNSVFCSKSACIMV